MNRREFVSIAAVMPFLGSTADHNKTARKPLVLLPDTARVYDVGRGEGRIIVGGEESGGTWWLAASAQIRNALPLCTFITTWMSSSTPSKPLSIYGWTAVGAIFLQARLPIVPQGTPPALGNWSKQAVRFLNSRNPAGFEQFFSHIDATVGHLPMAVPNFSPL